MVEQRNQADHGCGRYSKRSIVAGSIPALTPETRKLTVNVQKNGDEITNEHRICNRN